VIRIKKKYGLEAVHYIILIILLVFSFFAVNWLIAIMGIVGFWRQLAFITVFISIVLVGADLILHKVFKL